MTELELVIDNLNEIRKYLDDVDFCNSRLVCKLWSLGTNKEKKRRIQDKIKPIVLNHGVRHKMVTLVNYNARYGFPYYGICNYKGMKCAFYCPSSFKDAEPIWINYPSQFWGPYEKLLPTGFAMSDVINGTFAIPLDYEHYLTARVNTTIGQPKVLIDYYIHKHKYSDTFHIIEGNNCDIIVYKTPDDVLEKLEEQLNWDLIKNLEVLDIVHFEECHLGNPPLLRSVFTF